MWNFSNQIIFCNLFWVTSKMIFNHWEGGWEEQKKSVPYMSLDCLSISAITQLLCYWPDFDQTFGTQFLGALIFLTLHIFWKKIFCPKIFANFKCRFLHQYHPQLMLQQQQQQQTTLIYRLWKKFYMIWEIQLLPHYLSSYSFLATMSSSRSDITTQSVCPFLR